MSCYVFFAHVFSAVSVGVRCRVWTFRGQLAASSFPSFLRSRIQVLHLSFLVIFLGDIAVSPVLVVFAALSSQVLSLSTSTVSFPSEFSCCSCSPRVHLPSPHLRFVLAAGQSQGVKWEAWGPIIHRGPWGSA